MKATLTIDREDGSDPETFAGHCHYLASARPPTDDQLGDQTEAGFMVAIRWPTLDVSSRAAQHAVIAASDDTPA